MKQTTARLTAPTRSSQTSPAQVLVLLTLTALLVLSEMYVTIPLLGALGQRFGVTPTAAAWVGSAFGFAYAAGNLIFGPLSDRMGRLQVILPGLWALAALTLLVALSPSFAVLVALRALQGFAAATFPPAALAYLAETLPPRVRTTGVAVVSSSFLLSGILGQIYADPVSTALGWPAVFVVLVPLYVLLALLLRRLPATPPAQRLPWGTVFGRMGRLALHPPLVLVYLIALTLLLSFVAMYSGLSGYLTHTYGLTSAGLLLVRLAGLPGLLLLPFAGGLITRWGARAVATLGLTVAALGLLGEALLPGLTGVVLASAVFVTGIGFTVPAAVTLVNELGGPARGTATALYGAVVFLGASLGPLLASALAPHGFGALALTLAGILVVAALVAQVRLAE